MFEDTTALMALSDVSVPLCPSVTYTFLSCHTKSSDSFESVTADTLSSKEAVTVPWRKAGLQRPGDLQGADRNYCLPL